MVHKLLIVAFLFYMPISNVFAEAPAEGALIRAIPGGQSSKKADLSGYTGYIYPERTKAEGHETGKCVKGDCNHGMGTFEYDTGFKYEGEWKNGKKNGKGTFYYRNGKTATGSFKDGLYHGEITIRAPNGSIYRAYYSEGIMQ